MKSSSLFLGRNSRLIQWISSYEAICNAKLLLMRLEVRNRNITYDIVIVIGCILLAYLREVKQITLLSSLITEVNTEGMLSGVLR